MNYNLDKDTGLPGSKTAEKVANKVVDAEAKLYKPLHKFLRKLQSKSFKKFILSPLLIAI